LIVLRHKRSNNPSWKQFT